MTHLFENKDPIRTTTGEERELHRLSDWWNEPDTHDTNALYTDL